MTKNIQQSLKEAITQALQKIKASREKELCRYLPGPRGGYIHHFTFKKLKDKEPARCLDLIEQYILKDASPRELDPTPRAPRGLNRSHNQIRLPKDMVGRIIQIARDAGDNSLLSKLLAARPLNQVKRDLLRSIRDNQVNEELWDAYKTAVMAHEQI